MSIIVGQEVLRLVVPQNKSHSSWNEHVKRSDIKYASTFCALLVSIQSASQLCPSLSTHVSLRRLSV